MRTVVVTGLGVICATGNSTAEFLAALQSGRPGIERIRAYDPAWFHTQIGAEVKDFSFDPYLTPAEQRQIDRQSLLGIAAAAAAVDDSGFSCNGDSGRAGVILGTAMGPSTSIEDSIREVALVEKKPRPTTVPRLMHNAPVGHISIRHGCRGASQAIVTACSSSTQAIGQALQMIRYGHLDACLTGGTEPFPSYSLLAAWDTLRVMSRDNDHPHRALRPFSRDRTGFVMGEGAAILVLESEERARARGARIYAEVAGVGQSSDAHHLTQPLADGFAAAMQDALRDAGVAPETVQYINAHGTGTPVNDPLETEAIKRVFGDHARKLAVSSTKSAHGHAIGATGAIEAAATILGIHHGFVPATLHLADPDPACDLDYVPHEARALAVDTALSNSFAFGGHNAVLVLRKYRG
jgi:3-oxoacyl-[acyl-carrier-protein] synthase II